MLNKTLNVGVIGLRMGETHAAGVKEVGNSQFLLNEEGHKIPAACLYAVCDINQARAEEVGRRLGAAHVYTDYKDMIADPALDAVIIASPDQDHREMVENTLAAGKHILCEKPLALTREDCEAIVKAVKNSDRKFMVGQICRYTPGFKQAKEIIESGAIGELTFVESEYAHDYSHIYAAGSWRSGLAALTVPMVQNRMVHFVCFAVMGYSLSMLRGPMTKIISENTAPGPARLLCTLLNMTCYAGPLIASLLSMATPHKLQSFRLAEVYQHILWITSVVLPAKAH